MDLPVLITILGFSIVLLIVSKTILQDKDFAKFYELSSYTVMLILGIVLVGGSGIAFQTGNNNITQSGDETIVIPETVNYGWADTVIGTIILLIGLGGLISSIGDVNNSKNPYKGGTDFKQT